jgi:hypothetical protein
MTESPSQSGTVLDSILVGVREELAAREARTPLVEVKAAAAAARPALDALAALRAPLMVAGATLAATTYVGAVDPNEGGHYPACPFLALTGLYCPACGRSGSQRAPGGQVAQDAEGHRCDEQDRTDPARQGGRPADVARATGGPDHPDDPEGHERRETSEPDRPVLHAKDSAFRANALPVGRTRGGRG